MLGSFLPSANLVELLRVMDVLCTEWPEWMRMCDVGRMWCDGTNVCDGCDVMLKCW